MKDGKKMKAKAYEKELRRLQVELCHIQEGVKATGEPRLSRWTARARTPTTTRRP